MTTSNKRLQKKFHMLIVTPYLFIQRVPVRANFLVLREPILSLWSIGELPLGMRTLRMIHRR